MSKTPIEVLSDGVCNGGHGCVVAKIGEIVHVVYHLTPFGSDPAEREAEAASIVKEVVLRYPAEQLLMMGDHNQVSPQDAVRYDEETLCGQGGVNYCKYTKT